MVTTAPDIFKTTAYLLLDLPITPKIMGYANIFALATPINY